MSMAGAFTLLISAGAKLVAFVKLIYGWFMAIWGAIEIIGIAVAMIATKLTPAGWAITGILAGLAAVSAWWTYNNDAADETVEKLRKQQEILVKNAKIAKQQKYFGSGATFGSAEAAAIMFGANEDLAIQRQQLEYLRRIAEVEDKLAAAEVTSNQRITNLQVGDIEGKASPAYKEAMGYQRYGNSQ